MSEWNRGFEYKERLGVTARGLTLIEYVTLHYPRFSRQEWLDRINSGRVLIDGLATDAERFLQPGQVLSWLRPPWQEPEVPRSFAVLYLDREILGVAKPMGLPTMPGGGDFMDSTLLSVVRVHFPTAVPVHRLGRGTSGVVLFAITQEAASIASKALSRGEILKVYRALVSGLPSDDEFQIDTPIGPVPHPILKTIHAACPGGKAAHSHVTVLERRDACSLVQVRIATGRPHQIRIHLAASGHPLVGDPLYVHGGIPAEHSRALPGDLGYHLHSMMLGFNHPATNRWIEITCMPPPLLRESESEE